MTWTVVSLASPGDSESEGGLTPPPLKRARLSVHHQTGEPSFTLDRNSATSSSLPLTLSSCAPNSSSAANSSSGSMSGPSRLSSKPDVGQQQQSNGVTLENVDGGGVLAINGDNGLVNGVGGKDEREMTAEGGLEQHMRVRRRPQRQLTGMDADIVRLIGQYLREMGFK